MYLFNAIIGKILNSFLGFQQITNVWGVLENVGVVYCT